MYSNNKNNINNNSNTTAIIDNNSIISTPTTTTITSTISSTKDYNNNNNNNNNKNNNINTTMDNLETKYYLEIVFILVLLEMCWRFYHCNQYIYIQFINMITFNQQQQPYLLLSSFLPCFQFIISYILCILTIWLGIKKWNIAKYKILRDLLTILYGLDGMAALLLGYSIYIKNNWLLFISILISTKLFLLHFLSRMVTGLHAYTNNAIILQTTKTYLHHLGSFFFLSSTSLTSLPSSSLSSSLTSSLSLSSLLLSPLPSLQSSSSSSLSYPTTTATTTTTFYVILITSIWRFISLSGHGQLSITHLLSPTLNYKLSWLLVYGRNLAILITFILIVIYDDIRRGFALSAVGHVAYIGVRAGAIFRLGGPYIEDKIEGMIMMNG